jgi:tetratricopeptide (TPR) repeat protein
MNDSLRRRNPYIIGRPITEPELFFGRDALFQFIADNLVQGSQVTLLHGQRRIGKSSILAQIPLSMTKLAQDLTYRDLKEFAFISLSLEGDSRKPLGDVLHELARDSLDQYDFLKPQVELPSSQVLSRNPELFVDRFLPEFRNALGAKNIVMLLDEFDALGDYNPDVNNAAGHLFPFLQSEIYGHRELFIIPVVGRQLSDLPSLLSLFREAPYREVGLLDSRSTSQLIQIPARGTLEYHPESINAIWEFAAGHPYFTQLIGFALFTQAREEDRWFVTPNDVVSIIKRAIELGEGGLGWFWSGIPLPDRVVFSAAAEIPEADAKWEFTETEPLQLLQKCGVEITDEIRHSVNHLVDWKFLQPTGMLMPKVRSTTMTPRIPTYRVTIELVRRWLVKKHPVRREIRDELSKLNPEAERLYEAARSDRKDGTTPGILSQLRRALKLNPNHFGVLLELGSSLAKLGQFEDAIDCYERAYQMDPLRVQDEYAYVLCDYAEDLRDAGLFEAAIAQLETALQVESENPRIQTLLNQIQRARELDARLKVNPLPTQNIISNNVKDLNAQAGELITLQNQLNELVRQVTAATPENMTDKAQERLDDLQEMLDERKVDYPLLVYIYRWFSRHLPGPISQTVSTFIDRVIAEFGDDETEKSRGA